MRTIISSVVAVVLLLPGTLRAQDATNRIQDALARAEQGGIPVELLESKIAEGKAKGVPMERIADAVERRADALDRARTAIARGGGVEPTEADLSMGAAALRSGVSEAVLETIGETAPEERRTVAIAALTELVQQGHVPEEALARVTEALERGPDAIADLPAQAAAARDRRGPPAGIADRVGGLGFGPGAKVGPPASVPAPGQRPGVGKPDNVGKPDGVGPGAGNPGGGS